MLKLLSGVIFVCIGMCVGCSQETSEKFFPNTTQKVNQLKYYKDERTNLCFVVNDIQTNVSTMVSFQEVFTYVPCNPEVEKLIVKK